MTLAREIAQARETLAQVSREWEVLLRQRELSGIALQELGQREHAATRALEMLVACANEAAVLADALSSRSSAFTSGDTKHH